MIKSVTIAALFVALSVPAFGQAPARTPTQQTVIDSMFGLLDRLTEGASPAERLCYFANSQAEYRKCRFRHIMKETWIGPVSTALCRFDGLDELPNGNGKVRGLGSGIRKEISEACQVHDQMKFEWKLIQRVRRVLVPDWDKHFPPKGS